MVNKDLNFLKDDLFLIFFLQIPEIIFRRNTEELPWISKMFNQSKVEFSQLFLNYLINCFFWRMHFYGWTQKIGIDEILNFFQFFFFWWSLKIIVFSHNQLSFFIFFIISVKDKPHHLSHFYTTLCFNFFKIESIWWAIYNIIESIRIHVFLQY
jgi:hypothetical protein